MRKWTIALLVPLLAGCQDVVKLVLAKDYPERHLHALAPDPGRAEETAEGLKGAILAVKPFTITTNYEGTQFVYRKSGTIWETDYQENFFVPPGAMVTGAARTWLSSARIFEAVTGMSSSITPTYILEGHVAQLWIDIREDKPITAVIEVQFILADDRQTPAKIVLAKSYTPEPVPMAKDTPEEAVQAWDKGLNAVLVELEKDVRAELGKR